jgi:hypothetical protein
LTDYGLTADETDERFATYREQFLAAGGRA